MGARRKPTVGLVSSPDAVVEVGFCWREEREIEMEMEMEENEGLINVLSVTKEACIFVVATQEMNQMAAQFVNWRRRVRIEIKQLSGQNSHVQWA
uniref:Uncharacterized protein n=1 Tax=Oryza nivara TaxID=4536 RepID=A0A0E0HXU6_ORYNI